MQSPHPVNRLVDAGRYHLGGLFPEGKQTMNKLGARQSRRRSHSIQRSVESNVQLRETSFDIRRWRPELVQWLVSWTDSGPSRANQEVLHKFRSSQIVCPLKNARQSVRFTFLDDRLCREFCCQRGSISTRAHEESAAFRYGPPSCLAAKVVPTPSILPPPQKLC